MNNIYTKRFNYILTLCCILIFTSCDKLTESEETPYAPYVFSLGITASGTTTYYVVSTDDLMTGNINAIGKGIEQSGYRDYEQGNETIFSIGGLGVNFVKGITRDANGYLQEEGDFVFNSKLSAFNQVDDNTMIGMEIPAKAANGNQIQFYLVDINSISIKNTITQPIAPIAEVEWPNITGIASSANNVYVTYIQMNPNDYKTEFTDTTYVAVYSYPDMTLKTIMKDTRTGPAGSWSAHNGILKTESEDLYIMSNSSMANGFSKGTKNAAFLRIPKGQTVFDNSYFFDFETKSGGLKPAHVKYIGDGLVFAEVSTLNPQKEEDRWSDKDLKCCIIDLYNQTITDINEIPIHSGVGGRRFMAMVDGGYVYYAVPTSEGIYIYKINPQTATAERGAKVSATFVAGFFKMN